jgi:hypothetical protein
MIAAATVPAGSSAQAPVEPSALLVEVTSPAKFIGFPAVCPGSAPEENQEDLLCFAELYEAKVKVLRHLGGAPTERRLTIRFMAHSFHAVWQKDVRFLLVTRPFEDKGAKGHFASYWDWENDMGLFCVGQEAAATEDWEPLKRLYARGKKRVTKVDDDEWSKGSAILCVSGVERLAA